MANDSPTVLVVDDEELIRMNLIAWLEDESIEAISAASAEEGLRCVESRHFDIAIVDMRLPGMNGNEFILEAHRLDPQLRFIIHTGSTEYRLPDALLDIGIDTHQVLHKPLADLTKITEMFDSL